MKIVTEKKVVTKMIEIYCKKKHKGKVLCIQCDKLNIYALGRLDQCRYGDGKGPCGKCSSPCYKPEMKEEIRKIMRFSGPRLIFYSPCEALVHLYESLFK